MADQPLKTTEAHNSTQIGHNKLTPALGAPRILIDPNLKSSLFPTPNSPLPISRNWKLPNLRRPRAEALEAIAGAQSVPAAAKALLIEAVNSLDAKVDFVEINAHGFFVNGRLDLLATVKPL